MRARLAFAHIKGEGREVMRKDSLEKEGTQGEAENVWPQDGTGARTATNKGPDRFRRKEHAGRAGGHAGWLPPSSRRLSPASERPHIDFHGKRKPQPALPFWLTHLMNMNTRYIEKARRGEARPGWGKEKPKNTEEGGRLNNKERGRARKRDKCSSFPTFSFSSFSVCLSPTHILRSKPKVKIEAIKRRRYERMLYLCVVQAALEHIQGCHGPKR